MKWVNCKLNCTQNRVRRVRKHDGVPQNLKTFLKHIVTIVFIAIQLMDSGEKNLFDILPSFRSVKDFERNPIFFRCVSSTHLSFRQVQNCWNWIQIVGKAATLRRGVYECIEFLSMYRTVFRYIKNFRDLKNLKAKTLNTQTSREVFIRLVVMFSMNSFCTVWRSFINRCSFPLNQLDKNIYSKPHHALVSCET